MRYIIGTFVLYCLGWLGGDILYAAFLMGVSYGFIDLMKPGKI